MVSGWLGRWIVTVRLWWRGSSGSNGPAVRGGRWGQSLPAVVGSRIQRRIIGLLQRIILAFCQLTSEEMASHLPMVVVCDRHNRIERLFEYEPGSARVER